MIYSYNKQDFKDMVAGKNLSRSGAKISAEAIDRMNETKEYTVGDMLCIVMSFGNSRDVREAKKFMTESEKEYRKAAIAAVSGGQR